MAGWTSRFWGSPVKKVVSPARRREIVAHVQQQFGVSERRACRVWRQPRATQRYVSQRGAEEVQLTTPIVDLARAYGRYGYRRITARLRDEGWRVNPKRVEQISQQEGLKVPPKQPNADGCG